MRKIGNILNQIARRMHILGYVKDEKFLRKISEELYNLIIEIKRKYLLTEKVNRGEKIVEFCR